MFPFPHNHNVSWWEQRWAQYISLNPARYISIIEMIELQDETPLNRQSQCSIHLLTYEANSIYCLILSYSLPSIPTILIKLEFEWAFSMFINQNARSRKSKWSGNILNCWLMTAATLEGVKLRRDEAVLETRGFNLPRLRQQDHILSSTWNEAHVMKENVIW